MGNSYMYHRVYCIRIIRIEIRYTFELQIIRTRSEGSLTVRSGPDPLVIKSLHTESIFFESDREILKRRINFLIFLLLWNWPGPFVRSELGTICPPLGGLAGGSLFYRSTRNFL